MIYLYNDLTQSFLVKVQVLFKEILLHDFNLKFERKRFFYKGYYYPIHFAIFENEKTLAYFDSKYYKLGLSKKLIYVKESILKDVLRHEMLHYLTFIHHGSEIAPHGEEFKEMGRLFNVSPSVIEPSIDLIDVSEQRVGELESEKILSKVKKLFSLASSLNPFEAELAMLKAQELLIKHNLSFEDKEKTKDIFVLKVLRTSRKNAKLMAIYEILQFFMVHPILVSGKGEVAIEIVGSRSNIELAEYVATFLERTLDELWLENKKNLKASSVRAKNSFYQGIAEGYSQKMQSTLKNLSKKDELALVEIKKDLKHELKKIYSRLGQSRSSMEIDVETRAQGKKVGLNLSIYPATSSSQSSRQLLT